MAILKYPRAPLWIQVLALAGGLLLALLIARMVFLFGYVASGLAAYDQEQKEKQDRPIAIQFSDPNAPRPPAAGRRP